MNQITTMEPGYSGGHALVIGINEYQYASPLMYAENDVKEIASALVTDLGFAENSVTLLLGGQATKKEIMKSFLSYDDRRVSLNDRFLFFFAGHGHTEKVTSGEIGYLMPYDADLEDYSTLIRWDELTRNADRIPAKHVLFIIDACYGGIAVTRVAVPDAHRYFRDITTRRSRQVLAAGKADQQVSDTGGPLANHSIFTGNLLVALRNTSGQDKTLTANKVMAYVSEKVAMDPHSSQTPHYGQIDGDGDFVFRAPQVGFYYPGDEHPLTTYHREAQYPGAAIINAIIAQLRSDNAYSRKIAVSYIANILYEEIGESYILTKKLLLEAIVDVDLDVRKSALFAFSEHASEEDIDFVTVLVQALTDDEPEVRQLAVSCLEKLGQSASSAVGPLIECLLDDDEWTAENAAYALRSICEDPESILEKAADPRLPDRYRDYLN